MPARDKTRNTLSREELARRFWLKVGEVRYSKACWEWRGNVLSTGYGQLEIQYKKWGAHRLAWVVFRGPVPGGLCVLHHCDNRRCVNPAHLFLGTHSDNAKDRNRKNRQARGLRQGAHTKPERRPKGESNGNSKLTEAQVREIRRLSSEGRSAKDLSVAFGVTGSNIAAIVQRRTWGHLSAGSL